MLFQPCIKYQASSIRKGRHMRYAINLPNFGSFGNPRLMANLAVEAEAAGWDGFFIWDHVLWLAPNNHPAAEPWGTLRALAMEAERIWLGPRVTPLPRRRPWQVARQAVTLDQLSNGRAILGVGIGGDWFGDYSRFGEPPDDRTHGEQLDEALQVITGLWSAAPFSFAGQHYTVRDTQFLPAPGLVRRGLARPRSALLGACAEQPDPWYVADLRPGLSQLRAL